MPKTMPAKGQVRHVKASDRVASSLVIVDTLIHAKVNAPSADFGRMAEACGSRTHHSTREGPNHRL
jgi:hypothetical protein